MGEEQTSARALEAKLREIGESRAVERFLSRYGKIRTRTTYICLLVKYFRWLKSQGVDLSPDELVKDNLVCVFRSNPEDVVLKRKHTDWLNNYVNDYLLKKDLSESQRAVSASAIRQFYQANDSQLFGDYRTAMQEPRPPAKPLHAEDIRKVLQAVPVRCRVPLLVSWQTGIEINRVLRMKFHGGPAPQKVELYGRKGHRHTYWTYLGADSLKALQMLPASEFPAYSTVRKTFRFWARKLGPTLKNPDLRSWHPHMLRHSFSEECRHAKVEPEVREFFLGHVSGVKWVYLHGDLHEEDFVQEYRKVEPSVSLEPGGVPEFEKEKQVLSEYLQLRRDFEALKAEFQASRSAGPSPRAVA